MKRERVDVVMPPIRDDESGYKYLSKISHDILSNPQHSYIFDFSKCSTISHNGLVVIGGICDYLKQHEAKTTMFRGFGLPNLFSIQKLASKLMESIKF